MDGQLIRQSNSYRQGLVLGLTMAEIILLLIFCLLIAMASFIRSEQTKRASVEERLQKLLNQHAGADVIQKRYEATISDLQSTLRQQSELLDRMQRATGGPAGSTPDDFWRELVESQAIVAEFKRAGLTVKDIRDRVASGTSLQNSGIDIEQAKRNADVVEKLKEVMPGVGTPSVSPKVIADALARGLANAKTAGHQWPPIIKLSEADGHYFRSGSAELSPTFHQILLEGTPEKIVEIINKYDVDVIEVVGHTDEQPLGVRQSNLDRDLVSVLNNSAGVDSLVPADNAGLGLARAVSVVSVLRQSKKLESYKIIPLSGAQLVKNDETLALTENPGDVRERRRIEIRLRKSTPQETSVNISPQSSNAPPPPRRAPRTMLQRRPKPVSPPRPAAAPLDLNPVY
jgi:flagellar motor protein MotB